MFSNVVRFYVEQFSAPRPTPKLEDHNLSAVRDCLFNIFAAVFHIWKPFLRLQRKDAACYVDTDPLEIGVESSQDVNNTQSNIICIICNTAVNEYFRMTAVLLFYILQKYHLKKLYTFLR